MRSVQTPVRNYGTAGCSAESIADGGGGEEAAADVENVSFGKDTGRVSHAISVKFRKVGAE